MKLNVIILAAGEGKRMCSALPKVLHQLGGKTLLGRVIDTARQLPNSNIYVVCGHKKEEVREKMAHYSDVHWVEQAQQLGTGDAVKAVMPMLEDDSLALVLFGDTPLISSATLRQLTKNATDYNLVMLVADVVDPTGLGRVILDENGNFLFIVEEKDATFEQKTVKEIFTGIVCAKVGLLKKWLSELNNNNAQREYYLPDITSGALRDGVEVRRIKVHALEEVQGINDKKQLAQLERIYQRKTVDGMLLKGLEVADPERIDIRGEITFGKDVFIDINVILEGTVIIGDNTRIQANTVIRNCKIGNNVTIRENCVLENSIIEEGAKIGPFSRVRPDTHLLANSHVGNFVEIKKSTIGINSKVNHLSYVGDSIVGKDVNVGAGTITCNYDGANKHTTVIEDDCFIGSGTQLVAPVTIAQGGTIGAGSTITRNTSPGQLTISRAKQVSVPNWRRPQKEEK